MDTDISPDAHRSLAATLFNRTWDLLEAAEPRTADDDDELLTAAFASKFHWTRVPAATAQHLAVADNQIARVAAALGLGDVAVAYAARTLARTEAEGWEGWRLASALEVSARAAAAARDTSARDAFVERARAAVAAEPDDEERAVIEQQLASVPGRP